MTSTFASSATAWPLPLRLAALASISARSSANSARSSLSSDFRLTAHRAAASVEA